METICPYEIQYPKPHTNPFVKILKSCQAAAPLRCLWANVGKVFVLPDFKDSRLKGGARQPVANQSKVSGPWSVEARPYIQQTLEILSIPPSKRRTCSALHIRANSLYASERRTSCVEPGQTEPSDVISNSA